MYIVTIYKFVLPKNSWCWRKSLPNIIARPLNGVDYFLTRDNFTPGENPNHWHCLIHMFLRSLVVNPSVPTEPAEPSPDWEVQKVRGDY